MNIIKPKNVKRSYNQTINSSPDKVFPLLCPVKEKDWGFIDISGNIVIPTKYDINPGFGGLISMFTGESEFGFRNGLARVKFEKKWGFLNTKGEVLGNKWFENAELFVNTQE